MEVPLETLGGLVTSMRPSDLPDGASPRTYDTDFIAGAVTQRPGKQNVYTYQGISLGPDPGGEAIDTPILGGTAWLNPSNVLANDSLYSTVDLIASATSVSGTATISQGSSGASWINPLNLTSKTASTYVGMGGTSPSGPATTSSTSGTVTQAASGAQWQQLQYLFANPESMSVSLGGTSGTDTITYPGSPASGSLTSVASSSNPVVTETQVSTFASEPVYGSITVNCNVSASFSSTTTGGGSVQIQYSTNGGSTWSEGYATSGSTGSVPVSFTVSGVANTNNFQVQLFVLAAWGTGGSISVQGSLQGLSITFASTGTENPVVSAIATAGSLGLSMPSGSTFTGLAVSFKGIDSGSIVSLVVQMTASGVPIGSPQTITMASTITTYNLTASTLGISSLTSAQVASLGVQMSASVGATAPTTLVALYNLSIAVDYNSAATAGPTSSAVLSATNFGITLPPNTVYSSVTIGLKGLYAGAAASVAVRLTVMGTPIGTAQVINLTTGSTQYSFSVFGVTSLTATQIATIGVQISAGVIAGAATTTVTIDNLTLSLAYTGNAMSDGLDVTDFGFYYPTGVPIGYKIALTGSAPSTATVKLTMLKAGVPVGTPATVALTSGTTTVSIGGMNDLFNASWTSADINSAGFGLRITASGSGIVSIGYVTIQMYLTAVAANFTFFETFKAETGIDYNLALDTAGNWWLENITTSPGILQLALAGTTPNSYGSGTTVYDRAFVANSNLSGNLVTGSDIPRQYNFEGQWWDRITQVGPGAPPAFAASQASGAVANITSVTISSNVAIITAVNSYTAGEVGTFSGLSGTNIAGMNGQTLVVLSTGLSGTQFEVSFTAPNTGATAQSGATFTPQYVYPISTITQPAAYSDPSDPGHLSVLLWSAGPGSTSSGNVITVYYQSSFNYPTPDETLVQAFNAGNPVYVYITNAPFGNGIWQVTSIGNALPPTVDHWRYYFTIQVPTISYQIQVEPGGQYEITQGTVTTSTPVPGLSTGSQVSISNASVAAWDGVYPVVAALNSGSYNITQSALTGGIATYTWSLVSGTAPVAGQLVTITNTLNANGILNVTDAIIATATGSTSGTFTVSGFSSTLTYPSTVEEGQATTAGTTFIIDPGAVNAGSTGVNPILGNSTGGSLAVVGAAASGTLPIGAGTRQGVVIFITRNGLYTAPSPPVTFTVAEDANYITASNIPIGPPNVISRLIALTEAGQLGVAGANFYTTTVPTIFTVGGVQYISSSFLIPDNQTTTAKFTFSDSVLLNGDAIDVEGNDLFNLIEIGNPAWILQYADRTFYGGCQNKIQNFNNLSFDGGYLQPNGSASLPLGWTIDPSIVVPYGTSGNSFSVSLRTSPIFGNSYYIFNGTGAPATGQQGLAVQSAYQDAYNETILDINTPYSVRVTCRAPSGLTGGNLIIELNPAGDSIGYTGGTFQYLGLFSIPVSTMTTAFQTFTGTLTSQAGLTSIPSNLQLQIWTEFLSAGGDVEIDRIEIFPTNAPVLNTKVLVSYEQEPEQVDGVTGQITLASQSQDQVYGAIVLHDALHFQKKHSMIECEDAANLEPSQWSTREVSQRIGTCGPNAFDYGDEWSLTLDETGIYTYNGGIPGIISRELQGFSTGDALWDQIQWKYKQNFWLANDLRARRFYVGLAMQTPNFWLPNAPASSPTQPNIVLMCNYDGIPSYSELEEGAPVHVTMFGSTKALDMRRKWSLWQIVCPFGATVLDGNQSFETVFLGNGTQTGKIYRLIACDQQMTDDGALIAPLYTTYGMPGMLEGQQKQLGAGEKLATYFTANIEGSGSLQLRWYPNTLGALYPQTNPLNVTLQDPAQNNIERRMEVRGQRIFTEFSMNQGIAPTPGYFELSSMMIDMMIHPWGSRRGISQ